MATVEWNQQKASTSSWCLELAIAKRCRSNKLARQRFAFALRFSRWFRAKNQQILAGFITEEAEADTVADQGLKRVNHIFGGLNEGIWPKTEELTKIYEVCWKKCRRKKMNSRCLESVAQDLVSAMMTSAYLLEKATSSNDDYKFTEERCTGMERSDELALTSAEQFWNLSNGHISNRGYLCEGNAIEE
ncbi:hypothetical protein F511_34398 [Dorcoceras hygrometricum]|uniref:Uncharacterized protein n=1 Tax=Dorcoceras hygrometricum TaxID=472368 RepID=A0A2Z7C165_9LAMI|nr:hypothetical protein F511_34398 [Dorcoceras hygrometricum]